MRMTNARELAFAVLDEFKTTSVFVRQLLDAQFSGSSLSDKDRRLATEIVYGIVRRQATLDALIQPHVKRPRHNVEDRLWTLMQMGVYQFTFMSSIPPHAAVHETVEVAKRLGKSRWSGFLNGVLRAVLRNLSDEFTEQPAADSIPIAPSRYRKCAQPVFGDPVEDPAAYVSQAFSFPRWLIDRWAQRFDFEELVRLGFWFNMPAKLCLRVNSLKTTREKLLEALDTAGIEARAGEHRRAIWLDRTTPIEQLPGFDAGWFSVQDESAMPAAELLAPQPGQMVLDLCAAPGTKTMHLAELMDNRGTLIATDVKADRLTLVEKSSRRLGLDIVQPRLIDSGHGELPHGPFDAILVDVPCSNTGVLGKRPEVRWRLRPNEFHELAGLQQRLLSTACDRLKPNGRIVYSTCSLEPEENSDVVRAVLEEHPELQLVEEIVHVPGRPADGGYQALCLQGRLS